MASGSSLKCFGNVAGYGPMPMPAAAPYAACMLIATTGMRGEVAGLRDLDMTYAALRRPRVVVDYPVHLSEPKTHAGRRLLALDPATVAALRYHLVRRDAQRAAQLRALSTATSSQAWTGPPPPPWRP